MKEVPFLGVVVGEEGVKPNLKKVQVLQDWLVPQAPHDVKPRHLQIKHYGSCKHSGDIAPQSWEKVTS